LTEAEAWRTVDKVSKYKFKPGDKILFRGGDIFNGNMNFDNDEGTDFDPIRITSYGVGKAILQTNSGSCISIINNGGFIIYNLEIKGLYDPDKDYSINTGKPYSGITVYSYAKKKCYNIFIIDCIIRNFRNSGISIGGDKNPEYGYTFVKAEKNSIYNCGDIGIFIWGLVYQNIQIIGNTIHNIKGLNPHPHGFSGNGISLSHIYNAVVERNLIFNNGLYAKRSGGGVVTGESKNIYVRYNEIYGIKSNDVDGDAIDFDNGSDSCIAEFNYTHQNEGAGYLISGENKGSGSDYNIIRYNISKNDGLKNDHGVIKIYSLKGADNNRIYNNTVITTSIGKNSPSCLKILGPTSNTLIENNIFISVNSAKLIDIDNSKQTNLILKSNAYFVKDGMFIAIVSNNTFRSYDEFIKITGFENYNSVHTGITENPNLKDPFTIRDTINNPYNLYTLTAYQLYSFSPLVNAGTQILDIFSKAETDFFGNKLTIENPPDIGAHEY